MRPPAAMADGTNAHLRATLTDRGLDDVPAVLADMTAHPFDARPVAPERQGLYGK